MAFDKFRSLKCFTEADKRIKGGIPIEDVAKFVQEESGEYTEIKRDSLIRQLYRYKDSVPANQLAIPEAKHIHEKLKEFAGDVDEVEMLQKLFYVQMDRVMGFREIEKTTKFPIKAMYKEIEQAKDILVKLGELKIKLGMYEGAATERLAVTGSVTEKRIMEIPSDARERLGSVVRDAFAKLLNSGPVVDADVEVLPAEIVSD